MIPALSMILESSGLHRCPHTLADAPPAYCGCAAGECATRAQPQTARILIEEAAPAPADEIDFAAIEDALEEAACRLGVLHRRAISEDCAEIRHIAAALADIAAELGLPEPRPVRVW